MNADLACRPSPLMPPAGRLPLPRSAFPPTLERDTTWQRCHCSIATEAPLGCVPCRASLPPCCCLLD